MRGVMVIPRSCVICNVTSGLYRDPFSPLQLLKGRK